MDNLALTRIAADFAASLPGSTVEGFRQDSALRFRVVLAGGSTTLVLAISLRPELPWIGRLPRASGRTRWSPDPFAVAAARELSGRVVRRVSKAPGDRALLIAFAGGSGLAVELVPRGPNLVLLGEGDKIRAVARRTRGSSSRLAEGLAYAPRPVPARRLDPFEADAATIDRALAEAAAFGEPAGEALARIAPAIGRVAAAAAVDEAGRTGRAAGSVLRERIDAILRRATDPVIEGPAEPRAAVAAGTFTPERFRLVPWTPDAPREGAAFYAGDDPAATAGLYYSCLEEAGLLAARAAALHALAVADAHRTAAARGKAREALAAFADPDRFRREGEALLAGLAEARRDGPVVNVPDPYAPDGPPLAIEAPPAVPLTRVADDLFRKNRRARRGREAAARRIAMLGERLTRLDELAARAPEATSDWAEAIEADLRALGLPVGLTGPNRAQRTAARVAKPSLEGVRVLQSTDGLTILVGRTGRDNDRLTFKIAGPDDLWLHAKGVPGAHVVVRSGGGAGSVPRTTLVEAARRAAWFSDARSEAQVDVQWARRKHVRRAKGAGPGTVVLKRFETLRVRPEPPTGER